MARNPLERTELTTHMLSPEEDIVTLHGQYCLCVSGSLLAVVYDRCMLDGPRISRNGTIWDWRTSTQAILSPSSIVFSIKAVLGFSELRVGFRVSCFNPISGTDFPCCCDPFGEGWIELQQVDDSVDVFLLLDSLHNFAFLKSHLGDVAIDYFRLRDYETCRLCERERHTDLQNLLK